MNPHDVFHTFVLIQKADDLTLPAFRGRQIEEEEEDHFKNKEEEKARINQLKHIFYKTDRFNKVNKI